MTGSAADGSYAQGGGGAGLNVSNYFRTSVPVPADRSYTFTGAVVATGGDASAPPGTSAIGGPATGILAAGGLNFISEGTVVATAGSGTRATATSRALSLSTCMRRGTSTRVCSMVL